MENDAVSIQDVTARRARGGALAVLDEAREMLRPSTRQTKDGRQLHDAIAEVRADVAALVEASAAGLSDLLAMIDAADRGEVWTVNAGTRLRVEAMAAALANVGGAA